MPELRLHHWLQNVLIRHTMNENITGSTRLMETLVRIVPTDGNTQPRGKGPEELNYIESQLEDLNAKLTKFGYKFSPVRPKGIVMQT